MPAPATTGSVPAVINNGAGQTPPISSLVRVPTGYQGYDPSTIFYQDPNSKTLSPFSSGDALTGAGFKLGQEKVLLPSDLSGYNVGRPINQPSDIPSAAPTVDSVKASLNDFQNSLFGDGADTPQQRQSSQLNDQITSTLAQQDDLEKEFQDLRTKLNSLDTPNLLDFYNQLRNDQGLPKAEADLLATKDAERNLEGGERTVSGNASPETEALFQAQLAEQQKPLTMKEQALNDRLTLANNYIDKAVSLKETDSDAARSNLEKAIQLVQDSITASNNRISTLNTLRTGIQSQIDKGVNDAQATVDTLVKSGALDKLPENDLSLLEHAAGMPVGSLAAIRDSIKPKSNVISTETDDNGNIAVITQNNDGSFSAHVVPGAKGKTTQGTGAGITPDAQATVQALAGQNPSTWTQDQWVQRRAQFAADFGEKAAQNLYDQTIPKPSATANQPSKLGTTVKNGWNSIVNFFHGL